MQTGKIRVLAAVALTAFTAPLGGADGVTNCAVATIKYGLELGGGASSLNARFNSAQLELLQKLNRVDLDHLARLDRIISPDVWVEDQLVYSPLPPCFPGGASCAKLIVVYQPAQVFGGYEYGHLVRWGPISSGRQTHQTPTGLFHLNWKSDGRHSTVDPDWFMPWYFNFGNAEGYSFHQYALPGRPASHACVRLLEFDARWLHEWGEEWRLDVSRRNVLATGTPVLIVGSYDFSAPVPWRSLAFLARRVELPGDPICQQH
jgi:L,D-transpeptidase catalytic domain